MPSWPALMGLYFGLLLDATGSRNLLVPILAHGLYDYLPFLVLIRTARQTSLLEPIHVVTDRVGRPNISRICQFRARIIKACGFSRAHRLVGRCRFTSSRLSGDADAKKIEVRRTDAPFHPALAAGREQPHGDANTCRRTILRPVSTRTVKAIAGMQRNITTRQDGHDTPRMSAVAHTLRALTRISARWPRFIMAIVILASCACAGYTFFFLKFKTDHKRTARSAGRVPQALAKIRDHI